MLQKSLNQKGFSLVELMVVVAIIGILAAIAVPQMTKFQAKARQSEAKTQLTALFTAEKAFFQEYSAYHSNFRAVGFSPEGQIRYNVGFGAAPVANMIADSSTGYNGGLGDVAAMRSTAVGGAACTPASQYCGCTTMQNGCAIIRGSGGEYPASLAANTQITTRTEFLAGATARIYGSTEDGWTIDQNKVLSQTTNGIE